MLVGRRTGTTTERCITDRSQDTIEWEIDRDTTGFSRMVTGWGAGFTLTPDGDATVVTAHSRFTARNALIRLMLPLISRGFHQTQQAILDPLKAAVERQP